MKRRVGFVSNSSSSSFICDVSGEVVAGWDVGLNEAEMKQCENGHTFSDQYAVCEFEDIPDSAKIRLVMENEVYFNYDIEAPEDKDGNRDRTETSRLRKIDCDDRRKKYRENHTDEEIIDKFNTDDFDDQNAGYEVPKEMCPICQFEHIVSEEALKYLEVKNGITIAGIKKEIKENFDNYTDFQKYLTGKE